MPFCRKRLQFRGFHPPNLCMKFDDGMRFAAPISCFVVGSQKINAVDEFSEIPKSEKTKAANCNSKLPEFSKMGGKK